MKASWGNDWKCTAEKKLGAYEVVTGSDIGDAGHRVRVSVAGLYNGIDGLDYEGTNAPAKQEADW